MAAPAKKKTAKKSVRKKTAQKSETSASGERPGARKKPEGLARPASALHGVGPARAQALADIGIHTVQDLLYYFPRRYIDRTITESTLLQAGQTITTIVQVQSFFFTHGKRTRLMAQCRTLNNEGVTLVWFRGVQYFRKLLEKGQTIVVSGRLEFFQGLQIVHPDFEVIDAEDESLVHVGRIIPLYPSGEALKKQRLDSRGFRRIISTLLEEDASTGDSADDATQNSKTEAFQIPETVPLPLLQKHGLPGRLEALRNIHYPENETKLDEARRRLKYEELYLFNLMMYHKLLAREGIPRRLTPLAFGHSREYEALLARLPFQLTGEQQKAVRRILSECRSDHSEAFLLQGDVGSGKTVTALAIALHYTECGIQCALLAPTEVLARQHFQTIATMMRLERAGEIELVVGSAKKKTRQETLARLQSGEVSIVVGTHALLEENVIFRKLGLVIIDEQHRFGVGQREIIRSKGENPDTIAMTATPIPRTLCLTEFADLKLVTLKEKPAGRRPIQTMRLSDDRRPGLYKSVRKQVGSGRQAYIVYPMIEESEKMDLRAATEGFEELRLTVFPDFRVELLHGRMKSAEKERVMQEFRAGGIQILVTTSVIEVGVDVPNATVMVIEHAERFGISQLHQLRGRVGRGEHESYCILMSDAESEEANERLDAVAQSQDGFYLAEVDMRIRGPGELLGMRQHGLPGFRLADLVVDRDLAEASYSDAREYPDVGPAAREVIRTTFEQGVVIFPN